MFRNISIYIVLLLLSFDVNARNFPGSFADLAEKLMPSVVNISTTQVITTRSNPFPFEFHQDHHLKICLEILENLNKEELAH